MSVATLRVQHGGHVPDSQSGDSGSTPPTRSMYNSGMPSSSQVYIHDALVNQTIFFKLTNRKKHILLAQKAVRCFDVMASRLSVRQERESLIAQALNTTEGRQALSTAMVEPIRRAMDYQGIGRRLLQVDELPQGGMLTLSRPEFVGTIPIRQDIAILPVAPLRRIRPGCTYQEESNGDVSLTRPRRRRR